MGDKFYVITDTGVCMYGFTYLYIYVGIDYVIDNNRSLKNGCDVTQKPALS
jgi:hypothetical protein